MKVLDTSFLISLYITRDQNHLKAMKMAEDNKNEEMILSDMILFETLTVLRYKGYPGLDGEAYRELNSNRQVRIFEFNNLEKQEIIKRFLNEKRKLSIADISVIYLAQKTVCEMLTFDEEMMRNNKK